ncbi:MAG TPA: DUF6531 domain-containing protein, partial [Thermoanaerobaculia bacterium]|nr:DUF6531 domain-containing protein [Thermoanaerobaculia bacterium]
MRFSARTALLAPAAALCVLLALDPPLAAGQETSSRPSAAAGEQASAESGRGAAERRRGELRRPESRSRELAAPESGSAQGAADEPIEAWSRQRLERELVERLARGELGTVELAELRRRDASPRRAAGSSTNASAAARLERSVDEAVERLRAAVELRASSTASEGAADAVASVGASAGADAAERTSIARVDAALEGAIERVIAAELLVERELEVVGRRLEAASAPAVARERWESVRRAYRERRARLLAPALALREARLGRSAGTQARQEDDASELAILRELEVLLAGVPRRGPRVLRADLPYRGATPAARQPVLEPTVVPTYERPDAPPPTGADFGGGSAERQAPLSAVIFEQAEELAFDVVRLFELVQTEIATEWYAGGMKGAEATLRQRAGNDVDQASLLIALLRASGFAARYVHGAIELPLDEMVAMLDLDRTEDVLPALRAAGVAAVPVVRGGVLAAVVVEHTWVEAFVPYSNYRGAAVDFSGMTWVPLAPALEPYRSERGRFLLRELAESPEGRTVGERVAEYLSHEQEVDPLSLIELEVETFLLAESNGETLDDVLGSRAIDALPLGLLPSTLPAKVVAITGESSTLASERLQRVRLRVLGEETGAPPLLELVLPISELLARRVSLSFLPAELEDHETTMLFGGLYQTPAYLLSLRPQLVVSGRRLAVGEGTLPMAAVARLEVEWLIPASDAPPEMTIVELVAGGHYALGWGAQSFEPGVPADPQETAPGDAESLGARVLVQRALDYGSRFDHAESRLAGLLGLRLLRPVPSLVVASLALEVDEALGLPLRLRITGADLDAARRLVEPIAYDGESSAEHDFLELAGLVGSAQERFQFEEAFGVPAISADLGLGVARDSGIEVVVLDASNVDVQLADLEHPSEVVAEIEGWARSGLVVEVPRTEVAYRQWRGSVWRVLDPATGASGHFLAGGLVGLAGGSTAIPLAQWPIGFLADALEAFGSQTNPDPLAAATISRVEATDGQIGRVGELLGQELAVVVRDEIGRPVLGAEVQLTVEQGGGVLLPSDGAEDSSVLVRTDERGMASALLRLGTDTNVNPVYLWQGEEELPSRASAHEIEAVVVGSEGPLFLDQPFAAIAMPGAAASWRRSDGFSYLGQPARWIDTVQMQVEDSHGNPVSNVGVFAEIAVGDVIPAFDGCAQEEDPDPLPGALFEFENCPLEHRWLGSCGSQELLVHSGFSGASFGLISGPSYFYGDRLRVEIPALSVLEEYSYGRDLVISTLPGEEPCDSLTRGSEVFDDDPITGIVLPREVRVLASIPVGSEGQSLLAARPGEPLTEPLELQLAVFVPSWEVVADTTPDGTPFFRLDLNGGGRWRAVRGEIEVLVEGGGHALPVELFPAPSGDPAYRVGLVAGPEPGMEAVEVAVRSVVVPDLPTLVLDTGTLSFETIEFPFREFSFLSEPFQHDLTRISSVLPTIAAISPAEIVLGATGRTQEALSVEFEIEPAAYRAGEIWAVLLEDGVEISFAVASERQGSGEITLQRGLILDPSKTYELQLVLNHGSSAEVRSERTVLPIAQSLLHDVKPFLSLEQEVDLLTPRVFEQADAFEYRLSQQAEVTLIARAVEGMDPEGALTLGAPITLLAEVTQEPGSYGFVYGPRELAPGSYRFELSATSLFDGHVETEEGFLEVSFRVRDRTPLGHAMVKGVDLFDGHLVVSREDFVFPARGPSLRFSRTWSSNHGNQPGPLGVGWAHRYDSRVIVTPFGEAVVVGAEGGGMRFLPDEAAPTGWRPILGYHGTLVSDAESFSFDFYAKDGTRYHYRNAGGSEFPLDFIEDTNGDRQTLVYARVGPSARLARVIDDAGRSLSFLWEDRTFAFWAGWVIVRIDAPGGLALELEYDGFGNLALARREGGARIESYAYGEEALGLEGRHLLTAVRNELDGAETSYAWGSAAVGVQGDVSVATHVVEQLVLPEGGVTVFDYDRIALAERAAGGELATAVTDGRGETMSWALNAYGSPLRISDPLGNVTRLEWSADDVLMTARIDANGARTDFEHDEHGNVTAEQITVTDFDGTEHTYRREIAYVPPAFFSPVNGGVIKDRVASRTDRDGRRVDFEYDERGNLLREAVEVTDVDGAVELVETTHAYQANGDRASTTNARGHTTSFGYDAAGRLSQVTAALGGVRRVIWNARSLPIESTDQEGRTTRMEYDSLGRVVRSELPDGSEQLVVYDDVADTRTETDAEGRATITRLDREGRVVRIENAAGGRKLFGYDAEGNKTLETSWFDGETPRLDTVFEYDRAGRLLRREEPLGRVTTYTYDGAGNVIEEVLLDATDSSFAPRVTGSDYDQLDRVIETRRLLGSAGGGEVAIEGFRWDGEGNRIEHVDPLGRSRVFVHDELGRMIEQIEPAWKPGTPKVLQRLYDGVGNLVEERSLNQRLLVTGEWEPADQVRHFAYDPLDRLVERTDAVGKTSTFQYDRVGNVIAEIDESLERTEHDYDARDRRIETRELLTRVTQPARTTRRSWSYDRVGNLVEEVLPNGNVVEHAYDALDRLVASEDSLGLVVERRYDARGNVVEETDARGNTTVQVYDELDRVVEVRRPENRIERIGWDVAGNRVSLIDPLGRETRYEYDRLDRLVVTRLPRVGTGLGGAGPEAALQESSTFDLAGNRLTATDARGHTTTFEYDALDRLVRRIAPPPLSYETAFRYDAVGNVVEGVDGRGIAELSRYDEENRRTQLVRDGVVLEQVAYDPTGNRELVTDANGVTTRYVYDERDLLIEESRPLAALTRMRRDDAGDVIEEIDPEGRVTAREYDARRRLIAEVDGAGERTGYEVDGNGNRTLMRRPEGGEWRYRYDAADRLVEVEDPLGEATSYEYDQADNLVQVVDAESRTTSYEVDAWSRRVATVLADGAREKSAYDEASNRVAMLDPKGQLTEWSYDELDREVSRSYALPEEPTGDDLEGIDTAYDANGNVVRVDEVYGGATGTRTTLQSWDTFDRLERVESPEGTLVHGYDAKGSRTSLLDPDGRLTQYSYDALDRMTSTASASGMVQWNYHRDSRVRDVTYPGGVIASHTYDAAGRIETLVNRLGTTVVSSYGYTYDGNGNRLIQEETNGGEVETTTYTYDAADRLLGAVYPDRTVTYTYDGVGNRLTEREEDGDGVLLASKAFTYDQRHRLLGVTDAVGSATTTYTWDANGNQRSKDEDGELFEYLYDSRDRLTEVRRDGLLLSTHRFDFRGLRYRKSGPEGVERFLWDGMDLVLEADDFGNTEARYEWGADRLLFLDHAVEGRRS